MFKLSFMEQSKARAYEVGGGESRSLTQRISAAYRAYRTAPVLGEISVADRYFLFGGAPAPYNPSELLSRKGYRIIDEMRKDDQVKAASSFKKNSVLAAGWTIKAPKDKAQEWEPRQFVEDALNDFSGTFERCLLEIMTALDFGFSISETVFEERAGKIWIKKIATRKPHDMGLQSDIGGNLTQIKQGVTEIWNTNTPPGKFVVYSFDYEFSNHYGRSDLEAVYRPWWYKDNAYKWMGMLLERMGVPPIFALYRATDFKGENLNLLRDVLSKMQTATVGTIPRAEKDSLEMWSPELAGQVSSVFIPAIEQYNQDISRAQLMPGLLGLTQDQQQGSMARAKVHFDAFILSIERLRQEVAERVVNEQIVWPLVGYNFPLEQKDMPWFEWLPLTEDTKQDLMKTWGELVGSKVVGQQDDDEEHIRATLQFPELDEKAQKERADRNFKEQQARMPAPGIVDRRQQPGQPSRGVLTDQRPPLTQKQFEVLLEEFTDHG